MGSERDFCPKCLAHCEPKDLRIDSYANSAGKYWMQSIHLACGTTWGPCNFADTRIAGLKEALEIIQANPWLTAGSYAPILNARISSLSPKEKE